MKHRKILITLLALVMIMALAVPAVAMEKEDAESFNINTQSLIYKYADTVSRKDVNQYIELFTGENQSNMRDYVREFGQDNFFREESVQITKITELSAETGKISAGLSPSEMSDYKNILVYYVEMYVDDSQKEYKTFILVCEYEEWKILRVSTPDLKTIVDAGESFDCSSEHEELMEQENHKFALLEDSLIRSVAAPDADPTEITVYFKKTANKNHYGVAKKTLDWNTYLKNVIPNEWYVSYYDLYPEYLRAGTMASKMYAWWYIVHPKWNFSPYFADVMDNSNDQNFLYSAYDDLEFNMYRDDVDEVISWVRNVAMCDDEGNLFEVHYHATDGTQHSGQMSASGALTLAKNGNSAFSILSYYYNYSSYIGENHEIRLWGYV